MDAMSIIKNLHPLEVKVLRGFSPGDEISGQVLVTALGFNQGQANQALSWLSAKELVVEKSRTPFTEYEVTEYGITNKDNGTPEERLFALAEKTPGLSMPEIAKQLSLENKDVGSAFGQMSKAGVLGMDENKGVVVKGKDLPESVTAVRGLLEKAAASGPLNESELSPVEKKAIKGVSKKRGAQQSFFKINETEKVTYAMTPKGSEIKSRLENEGLTGDEIGVVTSGMLSSGRWKDKAFRGYNVSVPPTRVLIGRKNPYCEYLEFTKDKLVSLGFEEFDGPLVETEFWNGDALFMPQFHAARDIHDVYYVKNPSHAKAVKEPWLSNIKAAHENGGKTGSLGWGYNFDTDFTRRLILRSQGTVLSAKQLPEAKVPGKYFGVVRCFRYDQVDATHGADFYQTEGIVLGDDVNLKTLLGLLKMFAEQVAGAKEVRYVPAYFPFTEPSIEVHIKHPVLGWFELGGSGIFRPEVSKSLGVDVPVLAWGLGIDRMALMHLGLNDLRELFSPDIEKVRLRRRK